MGVKSELNPWAEKGQKPTFSTGKKTIKPKNGTRVR